MVYLLLSVGFCHIWGPPCCFCAALSLVARFQKWRFLIFMKETLMTLNSQSVACKSDDVTFSDHFMTKKKYLVLSPNGKP